MRGAHRVARVSDLVSKEPQFIRQHSLVVAAQVDPQTLQQLGELCWAANLPLVVCRTYGLLGSVRLQIRSLDIVESKSENKLWDLVERAVPGLDRMTDALDCSALTTTRTRTCPGSVVSEGRQELARSTTRFPSGGTRRTNFASWSRPAPAN